MVTVKSWATPLRACETICAVALILTYFLPWMDVMNAPVSALGLRDQLEGPHRLASVFTRASRISFDYSISLWLKILPLAAFTAALPSLGRGAPSRGPWRRAAPSLVGAACGIGTLIAFFYLRSEAAAWPLVDMAYGAGLAALAGAALAAVSLTRLALLPRG